MGACGAGKGRDGRGAPFARIGPRNESFRPVASSFSARCQESISVPNNRQVRIRSALCDLRQLQHALGDPLCRRSGCCRIDLVEPRTKRLAQGRLGRRDIRWHRFLQALGDSHITDWCAIVFVPRMAPATVGQLGGLTRH